MASDVTPSLEAPREDWKPRTSALAAPAKPHSRGLLVATAALPRLVWTTGAWGPKAWMRGERVRERRRRGRIEELDMSRRGRALRITLSPAWNAPFASPAL
eukprot:761987-Hanusia_phi.AAC.2